MENLPWSFSDKFETLFSRNIVDINEIERHRRSLLFIIPQIRKMTAISARQNSQDMNNHCELRKYCWINYLANCYFFRETSSVASDIRVLVECYSLSRVHLERAVNATNRKRINETGSRAFPSFVTRNSFVSRCARSIKESAIRVAI